MSRNGSGIYSAPTNSFNPAINGVSATAADWNALLNDLAAAITQSVSADGQTPITGSLNMNGNRLTGLAAGTATGQSVRWEQLFDQGVEADIASAATVDIGAQNTNFLRITGTTTITSFGTTYRGPRFVRFAAALTLTHNATTLILPTAANITTAAGDRAIIVPVGNPGAGWQVLAYQRADGSPLILGPVTAATMQTARILGRVTAGTGAVEELTGAQTQATLPIGQTRVDVASAATVDLTAGAANTAHVNITGTTTITAFTVAAGRTVFVRFAGALTLTNNASIVTQTGANITTAAGDTCILRATAANVVEVLCYTSLSKVNLGASVATTSGTAIDFTGIPSWANRVTVLLSGVSLSGTSDLLIRLGTSGGVEATGYRSSGHLVASASTVNSRTSTAGFIVLNVAAANAGDVIVTIQRLSGNAWVEAHSGDFTGWGAVGGGNKTLAGVLDRLRLTTVNGTDTFDAGSVNISWE